VYEAPLRAQPTDLYARLSKTKADGHVVEKEDWSSAEKGDWSAIDTAAAAAGVGSASRGRGGRGDVTRAARSPTAGSTTLATSPEDALAKATERVRARQARARPPARSL
jgi:hypothetical protein